MKMCGVASRLESSTPKDALDLIERLLTFVPSDRITAEEALKHEFFNELTEKPISNATSASSTRKRLRSEISGKTTGESSVKKPEVRAGVKKRGKRAH